MWLLHVVPYIVAADTLSFSLSNWPLKTFLFGLGIVLINIGPRIKDNFVTSSLYILGTTWLGTLFLLFSATLIFLLFKIVGLGTVEVYFGVHLVAALASVYALLNAWRLTVKEYTIPLSGLSKEVRLVHLSDVHIGTVHRARFLKRVVKITNAQNPDLVLMTGDLFDGSAPIHEEMLRSLDDITVPTYFSTGNHEEYEGLQHVRETIADLKMQLLDSQVATFGELQIIGVNDRQSISKDQSLKTILPTIAYDTEKPTILMYHTPVEWEEARAAGIDVMLSGHTHNGQVFPFTLLVHLSFKYVCGLYEEGKQYLHVTPGTGTWGPPMRLGSNNQVTVIRLTPQ